MLDRGWLVTSKIGSLMESTKNDAQAHGKSTTNTIEPCPFCNSGDQSVVEIDSATWAVFCVSCNAIGPHSATLDEASARWSAGSGSQLSNKPLATNGSASVLIAN